MHDIYIMSAALDNMSKLYCARLHDIFVSFTRLLVYSSNKEESEYHLFFGRSDTRGTIISSIETPPCWNVSL